MLNVIFQDAQLTEQVLFYHELFSVISIAVIAAASHINYPTLLTTISYIIHDMGQHSLQQHPAIGTTLYLDMDSLQSDAGTLLHLTPPPSLRYLHQNGMERHNELAPVIRGPISEWKRRSDAAKRGDVQDSMRYYSQGSGDNLPTTRPVWTVEPLDGAHDSRITYGPGS